MKKAKAGIIAALVAVVLIGHAVVYAQYGDDRYPFVRGGKVGFIDHEGREVIPPRFSNAGDMAHFNDGLAPVFEAGFGSGYIDTSGKFVIGPTQEWGWGRPFHEDLAAVLKWGKNNSPAWIDRTGKIIFTATSGEGNYFSDGLMPMSKDGKWGYVNKDFQFVIPPQYDLAGAFSEGRAAVTLNRKSGFIDVYGAVVVPLKYDSVWPFKDGLGRVQISIPQGTVRTFEGEEMQYAEKYGFVDHDGNEVINLQFKFATYFSAGYALAAPSNSRLYGVIDKRGNFVHPPEFENASEFSDGLAMACMKQKCGYIDRSGKWVIKPVFAHAESFRYGLARVSWGEGEYGYINKTGKTVWKHSTNTNQ
jgi:WG repeat protein